jgi:hypothetical protein
VREIIRRVIERFDEERGKYFLKSYKFARHSDVNRAVSGELCLPLFAMLASSGIKPSEHHSTTVEVKKAQGYFSIPSRLFMV